MRTYRNKKQPNTNLRYNSLSAIVYIIGLVLLVQLFNLQIINGQKYRDTSNTRLTRESTLYASRGYILDRTGIELATVDMTFSLEMYKTKLESNVLNETILKIINTLEENGDGYTDTLPIKINPYEYTFSNDTKKNKWLKSYNLSEETSPEEAFEYLKKKYKIENDNPEETRKILIVRYRISSEGYSSTRSLTISNNISKKSALLFTEQSSKYPGVTVGQSSKRNYPNGTLASHILGYINSITQDQYDENKKNGYTMNDIYGQTGIEYVFEPFLRGKNGIRQIDMSVNGEIVNEYVSQEAISGSDVVLTIDANLQRITENALKDTIDNINNGEYGSSYPADAGAIVVMDVTSGDVLAMASYPDFEPGAFVGGIKKDLWKYYQAEENKVPLMNRAIAGAYAPGSTFKMVTATAALQTGNVGIKEKVNDTGVYPRGHNPACWIYRQSHRGHGYLNVTDAIKHSCNYFFYEMGYRVGIEILDKYAKSFGLGSKTGIELTGELAGRIASPEVAKARGETWTVGYTLSAAIGQSYNSFTPIQMAKYLSILVNGGKQINPSIVKTVINADGTEIPKEQIQNTVNKRLGISNEKEEDIEISEENLQAILEGMKGVTTESGGTAYRIFRNFNIEIGGKTGSAQKENGPANAWFVGFAPYDEPEIAIVVIIENRRLRKFGLLCSKRCNCTVFWYECNTNRRRFNSNPISISER